MIRGVVYPTIPTDEDWVLPCLNLQLEIKAYVRRYMITLRCGRDFDGRCMCM